MRPRHPVVLLIVLAGLAATAAADGPPGPALVLDGRAETTPGVPLVLPLEFANNGHTITATAFSFDIATVQLEFDPTDADMDGIPDTVTFPAGEPETIVIAWDPDDPDGELDVLLANLSGIPLPEGVIMEFELLPSRSGVAASWILFSNHPPVSFSDDQGQDVDGTAIVLGSDLFADGFETGDTGAWSRSMP